MKSLVHTLKVSEIIDIDNNTMQATNSCGPRFSTVVMTGKAGFLLATCAIEIQITNFHTQPWNEFPQHDLDIQVGISLLILAPHQGIWLKLRE